MLSKGIKEIEGQLDKEIAQVSDSDVENDRKRFKGMLELKLSEANISEDRIETNEYYARMKDDQMILESICDFYFKLKNDSNIIKEKRDVITMMEAAFENYDSRCDGSLENACEHLSSSPEKVRTSMIIKSITNGD